MQSIAKIIGAVVLFAVSAVCVPAHAAQTVDMSNPAFATVGGRTSIPVGHAEFCDERPSECSANANVVEVMPLNQERWSQLLTINASANAAITPVTDADLYQVSEFWTYPNGYGDCEDFVLEKRRELIDAGWPVSTLLMTVVRQPSGEGHAVLMVRTDRGDLVLDNQVGEVLLWTQTPYTYLKRQAQANAGEWVDIVDNRGGAVAARN